MPASLSTLIESFPQQHNSVSKTSNLSIDSNLSQDNSGSEHRRTRSHHRRTHAVQLSWSDVEHLELRPRKRAHRQFLGQAALPPFQFPNLYTGSRESSPAGSHHSRSSSDCSTASFDSISSVDSVETTITEPDCEPIQEYRIKTEGDNKHDSFLAESPSELYPTHLRKISVEQIDLIEDLAYQIELFKVDESSQTRPIIVIS